MRKILNINKDWYFSKKNIDLSSISNTKFKRVNIPHTWNNYDGSDGDSNYYRGTCTYVKELKNLSVLDDEEVYLELNGVSQSAKVYFNNTYLGSHLGGYSTFRYNITNLINNKNILVVYADNSANSMCYPQHADFTFAGGIYRDVNLIIVPKQHFALNYYGSKGVKITPDISGNVLIESFFENGIDNTEVTYNIDNISTKSLIKDNKSTCIIKIDNVHLWNGLDDPYLYTLNCNVGDDNLSIKFGFRKMEVNSKEGFLLNGKSYPLTGVAKHQDREEKGYAVTKEDQIEDLNLIHELGANTIRLAHYQHDQIVYDKSDEIGFVLWTEIPYITEHLENGNDNTITQLTELIVQNYNHPSVFCWGLSNEITTVGGETEFVLEQHKVLNNLAHKLDNTRPTTIASLFMLDTDASLNRIPDLRSYNLYYGWYVGEKEENATWFDDFHNSYPDLAIGLSEYGADANPLYHSLKPLKGDYSESYQREYHDYMLKMRLERPYIWASHVWNMFDFAADARSEGGRPGLNQKGLVTYNRKYKKDAFYVFKAYLSKNPFVHICDKLMKYRDNIETTITVYSNQDHVSLYLNNKLVETKECNKSCDFKVKLNKGLFTKNNIKAISGNCSDSAVFKYKRNSSKMYLCKDAKATVKNWFEDETYEVREGYFSIYDKLSDIKSSKEGNDVYESLMKQMMDSYGDVAKNVKIPKAMQALMDKMTLDKLLRMAGHAVSTEMVKDLNSKLNNIKK